MQRRRATSCWTICKLRHLEAGPQGLISVSPKPRVVLGTQWTLIDDRSMGVISQPAVSQVPSPVQVWIHQNGLETLPGCRASLYLWARCASVWVVG